MPDHGGEALPPSEEHPELRADGAPAAARRAVGQPCALAVVVGAGIAGLATARALQLAGWSVQVLERAPRLDPLGAGISLWPNAMHALAALRVPLPAVPAGDAEIRAGDGRLLSRTPSSSYPVRYGAPLVAVHRGQLQQALLDSLPPGVVRTGSVVDAVIPRPDGVSVRHDGDVDEARLLVLADGLHSAGRALVTGSRVRPRYAGYTAWRGMIRGGAALPLVRLTESWGRGERFGIVPLADGSTYWFATAITDEGHRAPDGEHAEVLRRFARWHPPVPAVLAATDPDAVLRHDVYDVRPHPARYVRGRLVLVGDAAHAMTPNLGQGACQAIEDAVTLGALASPGHLDAALDAALARYDRVRRPRARLIGALSRGVGRIGQLHGRTAALRDAVVRAAPAALTERQLDGVLSWRPPTSGGG